MSLVSNHSTKKRFKANDSDDSSSLDNSKKKNMRMRKSMSMAEPFNFKNFGEDLEISTNRKDHENGS